MEPTPLADPVPVSPRHEQRLASGTLHFLWEPVAGAEHYVLEIARDVDFADLAASADAGLATEASFSGLFEGDGSTYFWRVLARAADTASPGERIESFIVQSPEELRQDDARGAAPQEEGREDLGPGLDLAASTGKTALEEAAAQPDDAWADELVTEGVEPENVAAGQILGIFLSVAAAVATIAVILFTWTNTVANEVSRAAASSSINPETARYPVRAEAEQDAERMLGTYEVLDATTGTYRIPIDQAIQIMANDAVRPDTAGPRAPAPTAPAR